MGRSRIISPNSSSSPRVRPRFFSNIVASGALTIDGGTNAAIVNQAMTLYRTHSFDGVWMDSAGDRTAYTMPNISETISSLTGVISGGQGVLITGRSFANIDVTAGAVGNIRTALDVHGSGASGGALSGAAAASGMQNNAVGGQQSSAGSSQTKTAPAIKSAALAARSGASVINVAPSGLAKLNPNPDGQYLFETRSEFANHGNWISSDYLLTALNLNADTTQKRLGDGFYEQRLVREQLSELTGRAPAGGVSDDSVYKALLDSGISYARQWDLRPGIALTATQIAHLTSDIVWLESETVTLPDGSTHTVLAPKVYLAHLTTGSVTAAGALVTGNNVTINVGNINNRGGLIDGGAGRTVLIATQDIINSSGNIKGATVALQAGRDIVNQTLSVTQTYASAGSSGNGSNSGNYTVLANQGAIAATGALTISAGRDLNNIGASLNAGGAAQIMAGRDISLTSVQTGSEHTSLVQSYSASDSSIGHQTSALKVGGDLTMVAAEDIKLSGAQIAVKGNGVLEAGRNMVVSAVIDDVKSDHHNDASARQYDKQIHDDESVVGASIQAGGDLALKAGGAQSGALSLLGSTVAATGDMSLAASGDVTIATVTEHHLLDVAAHDSSSGFLSKRTSSSIDYSASSVAVGSSVEGKSIAINSGNDIAIKGSTIVADKNIDISAVRDLSVVSAQNTQTSNNASSSTNSGLMSGSMGFAIGKVSSNNTGTDSSVTQVGSQIASLGGNVKMKAGGLYTQTASQIDALAPTTSSPTGTSTAAGDVSIVASKINMSGANDSSTSQNHADYSKTALGVSVDIPILDAVKSISSLAQAAGKTTDSRMQALAAATLVSKTVDLAKAAATPTAGVKVSLSLSNSKTASDSQQTSSTVVGSTVSAAGNVSIIATGAGAGAASTMDIIGSTISASNNATLLADGKITLSAATNTSTQTSTNSGSGWSAGVGYTFGPSAGTTFDFGANKANGTVKGQDTSAVNTYIKAGNTATLKSGGDTSMIGAVISGNTVDVNVAGKLNIASVQDTSTYASSNHSASVGASLCIPPFCVGKSSVSGSLSQSNATSDYASVIEQSGIKAGDGGFHVNVAGNTDLKGAVIASSDKAVSDGANSLHTGTLTSSDMENHARTDVKNTGISLSSDMFSEGKYGLTKGVVSNLLNNASESGSSSGQSRSAVSAGLVTITDDKGQQQLTGKTAQVTIDSLNRNTADAQTAAQKQDVQGMKQSVDAVQLIKNEAVQQVSLVTDAVYNAATAEKKILLQKCGADITKCTNTPVNLKDHDIETGPDKTIHVFNNGIMNTEAQALFNAAKQSQAGANLEGVYVVINPYTGSAAGEVLYAGWDYFLAKTLGISNASEANIDLVNMAKKIGASIDITGQSRGGLTIGNAVSQEVKNGETKAPITMVQLNGSAGNAEEIQQNVNIISFNKGQVSQSTHKDDKIGNYIGGNPVTGGQDSSLMSAHGTYGPNTKSNDSNTVWGDGIKSKSLPAQK